jgi:hypothetical protein
MRLLLLAAVVAAALLAWWLLAPTGPPAGAPETGPGRDVPVSATPTSAESTPSLTTAPPSPESRAPQSRDPRTPAPAARGKASLLVVPVPPSGGTVPGDLRAEIELVGGRLAAQPLPTPLADGSLRYESLPPGAYRVRLSPT